MSENANRELIVGKLRDAAKRAEYFQTGEAGLLNAAADALEGTLTEPEWQYQARVEWHDPYDERRRPNFYIGKDRAFTAEEMANPVLIDDMTGRNMLEGCYLKDHVKRRKAGPWLEVSDV